jgi:hypothetical protein
MKIKIQIKHYLTGSVLFEFEKENNTIKDTVTEAIKQKADLSFADLRSADLRSANLRSADLRSADLRFADLSFADLSFADLRSANLRSANLRSADLSSANLRSADLRSANLSSANLRFANLRSADLSFADLRSADLRSANLRSAENLNNDSTNYWWHIHHEVLYEWLTEPLRARINYIKNIKSKSETGVQIKLRLKLLKPVLGDIPLDEEGWEKLHKKECKNCPWNGKSIFD